MRILLVEDHRVLADLMGRELLMRRPTASVVTAHSLAEARAALAEGGAPDVIVTDLQLPDAAGLEALIALRAAAPTARIGVTSSQDSPAFIDRALAAGAYVYMTKGSDLDGFLRDLERLLAGA